MARLCRYLGEAALSEDQRGATAAIAAFACRRREPPVEHRAALARAVIDTVGCALAGHASLTVASLERWARTEPAAGPSTVWTTGERTTPSRAALLNGTAAHALDWDDVAPTLVLHPSTVLLPALLAVAEEIGASGRDVLEAHDVGSAVFRAVAEALPWQYHYEQGWHSTATVGRIAATAALCRLRRLTETQSRHALGLVASLVSGSLANFGTMTKPLHAGIAARDAVTAVGLAIAGFTANVTQLEARDGFFSVYGDAGQQNLSCLGGALERWLARWPAEWAIKRFPSCYATHRAAEAALSLHGLMAGRSATHVAVTVAPGQLRPLLDRRPRDPQEARFSIEYVVSLALLHGDVRIAHFTTAAFEDHRVASLMKRVAVHESAMPPRGPARYDGGYAVVEAELTDGTVLADRVDQTRGDARRPLADEEVRGKFSDCCSARGLEPASAAVLADALSQLPGYADFTTFHGHFTHPS